VSTSPSQRLESFPPSLLPLLAVTHPLSWQGFLRHDSGGPWLLESRCSSGPIRLPGETESGSAGTQPDKGYPGRWRAHGARGPWRNTLPGAALLKSHGTPEPCLKKSLGTVRHSLDCRPRFSSRARVFLAMISFFPSQSFCFQDTPTDLGLLTLT